VHAEYGTSQPGCHMRQVAVCISHKVGGVLRPYRMPSDGEFAVCFPDVSCRCRRINLQDIVVFSFLHHGVVSKRAGGNWWGETETITCAIHELVLTSHEVMSCNWRMSAGDAATLRGSRMPHTWPCGFADPTSPALGSEPEGWLGEEHGHAGSFLRCATLGTVFCCLADTPLFQALNECRIFPRRKPRRQRRRWGSGVQKARGTSSCDRQRGGAGHYAAEVDERAWRPVPPRTTISVACCS
jgi:hypothetical protein